MKHFTMAELTRTSTGLPNRPDDTQEANLIHLVNNLLDPIREQLGMPIVVNSGFRAPTVNKAVGGAEGSQHMKGEAADIVCGDKRKLFDLIRARSDFDQLIWEFGDDSAPDWVHVSLKRQGLNRREILRSRKSSQGKTYYEKL